VTDDLVPRIEILTDRIMQLSRLQASKNLQIQQTPIFKSSAKDQSDIVSLMVSAHELLNEAKCVVAQSEGSSDRGSYLDILEKDLQDSLTVTQGYQPDRSGGEAFDRHTVVENWIPAVSPATNTSHFDSSSITTRTQMTPTQSTCDTLSLASDYQDSLIGDDSDYDDDLELEILQGFLDRGSSVYKEGDWASAQKFFKRLIEVAKTLPSDKLHQRGFDLKEAQFKIAVCAFQENKLEEAEVELSRFRTTRPSINESRAIALRHIISTHLFAIICFRKRNLDEAYKHCRKAHSMKRKLLGKETPWLETKNFSLMMEIAKAKGDVLAEEVYQAKGLEYASLTAHGEADASIFLRGMTFLNLPYWQY
jgi:hypothetical protein